MMINLITREKSCVFVLVLAAARQVRGPGGTDRSYGLGYLRRFRRPARRDCRGVSVVKSAAFMRLVAIGIALSASVMNVPIVIGQTSLGVTTNDIAANGDAGFGAPINSALPDQTAPSEVPSASGMPAGSQATWAPATVAHLNILEFCVAMNLNGKTDNTACIQAAVTAMCTPKNGNGSPNNTGGTIDMPPNAYTINASVGVTIPCESVIIRGGGWGDPNASTKGTEIRIVGAGSAPIFHFVGNVKGNARRYSYGGGIRDIGFVTQNSASNIIQTGPMIAFDYCWHCYIDRVHSIGAFRFATNYAGLGNEIVHTVVTQVMPGGEAIEIYGLDVGCEPSNIGNCATRADIFQIEDTILDAALAKGLPTANCIHVHDFVATTRIMNVTCNQMKIGLYVDCPASSNIAACPQFLSLYDFGTEANDIAGSGANGAGISAFDFVDLECYGCKLYGYSVFNLVKLGYTKQRGTPGASNAKFFGGKVERSEGSCILAGIPGLQIIGTLIDNCGNSWRQKLWRGRAARIWVCQ